MRSFLTKKVILTNEFDVMTMLQEAILAHPKAAELLAGGVWQVSEEKLAQAGKVNERAIEELKSCREQDMWPTRYEEPRVLDVPTRM